jgi:hypothetical protein
MVERFNRTMASMMRCFIEDFNYPSWDEVLPYVMAAYRRTEHQSTGCTPNLMMLGRETSIPLDLIIGAPPGEIPCRIQWVEKVKEVQRVAHEFARVELKKSAASQKRYYDRGRQEVQFKEGDPVMYWYKPLARGALTRPWTGPVLVRKTWEGSHVYQIQGGPKHKAKIVHGDHLKLYEGTDVVLRPWWNQDEEAGQKDSPERESLVRGNSPPAVAKAGHSVNSNSSRRVENERNLSGPEVVSPSQGEAPDPQPPLDVAAEGSSNSQSETASDHREEEVPKVAPPGGDEKSLLELESNDPSDPIWKLRRKLPDKENKATHPDRRANKKGEKGEILNVVDIHQSCGPYSSNSRVEEQIGKAMAKMNIPGVEMVSSRPQRVRRPPDFYQAGTG